MAFVFRYQKILDVREQQQLSLEVALGSLERAVLDGRAELARWDRVRHDLLAQLRSAREGGDVEQNASCSAYLRYVRAHRARCQRSVADLEGQREEMRQKLVEAVKSCKVLRRYRDKLEAEYQAAQEKAEERTVELHSARAHVRAGRTP